LALRRNIAEQFLEPAEAEVVAFARRQTMTSEMVGVEVSGFSETELTDEQVAEKLAQWEAKNPPVSDVDIKVQRVLHGIILKEKGGPRELCVFVGPFEATSIALGKDGVDTGRPMTHDLFGSLIGSLDDVSLRRVVITKLEDETFYAEMEMTHHGERLVVDCRPSDGIAVAVRLGVPIFVSRNVPPFSQAA
jgi:bifunctional DNase/RNase